MSQQNEIAKMIRNDYARVQWYEIKIKIFNRYSLFSRAGQVQLDAFVLQDVKITLLDILWLSIAYGKSNKRTDAIESM